MVEARPERLYVTEWAADDPRAAVRIGRLASAMGHPDPPVLSARELAEVVRERCWLSDANRRTGAVREEADPDVVLNAFIWDEGRVAALNAAYPELAAFMLGGGGPWGFRDAAGFRRTQGCVCQPAYEVHSAWGCLHACRYCHVGRLLNIMCNLEALAERLPGLMAAHPWLRLVKYDNGTDTICLEPEYGASAVMVELFSRQLDRFLLLYTKSDNVQHLLNLPHGGRTLINWSLSTETAARHIERRAPSPEARIEAARRCQEAGYTVRFRLSPICPVENWRREATTLIESLFSRVQPDLVTMDVLGWMNARQMLEAMDVGLLEARFRAWVADLAQQPLGPHRKHIFPHAWRAEILRHYLHEIRRVSPATRVSVCMETTDMWAELGPELGMAPEQYVCCCGPTSVPGNPLLTP